MQFLIGWILEKLKIENTYLKKGVYSRPTLLSKIAIAWAAISEFANFTTISIFTKVELLPFCFSNREKNLWTKIYISILPFRMKFSLIMLLWKIAIFHLAFKQFLEWKFKAWKWYKICISFWTSYLDLNFVFSGNTLWFQRPNLTYFKKAKGQWSS